jgi:hypothetical protein
MRAIVVQRNLEEWVEQDQLAVARQGYMEPRSKPEPSFSPKARLWLYLDEMIRKATLLEREEIFERYAQPLLIALSRGAAGPAFDH